MTLISKSCVFPHLVGLVGVLSDEGGVDDLTLGRVHHDQLPHLRRTGVQAVMTLKEEKQDEDEEEEDGKKKGRNMTIKRYVCFCHYM